MTDNSVDFVLQKLDGRGKVSVEVCAFRPGKDGKKLWSTTVDNGKGNLGKKFRRKLRGVKGAIVTATIDGKSVANKFKYKVRLRAPNQGKISAPNRSAKRAPIAGFADLHAHLTGHLGFAGAWLYPDVEGKMQCSGDNHGVSPVIGGAFRGRHKHRRAAPKWEHHLDTAHQQMHIKHLRQAYDGGLRLILAPAVSNEFAAKLLLANKNRDIPREDMDSVLLQLRYAHALAAKHDWLEIVRDPWEARRAIADGKLAIVLAVEVSNLMPKSSGDWKQQLEVLYDLGVRSIELAHETDSDFSGRATHHGLSLKAANFIKNPSLLSPKHKAPKYRKNGFNAKGLTPAGRELVREMARRNMLISIDHVSRVARRQIYDMVADRSLRRDRSASKRAVKPLEYYPLFFSHSRFDALMMSKHEVHDLVGKGKVEGDAQLAAGNHGHGSGEYMAADHEVLWVRETGGVFGLRTGPDPIKTYNRSRVANTCQTSSRSLAQTYAYGRHRFGLAMSLGSDLNGFVAQTAPRFGRIGNGRTCSNMPTQNSDDAIANKRRGGKVGTRFDTVGLAHIGYEPDLIKDLGKLGMDVDPLNRSAEFFLRMWERTYDDNRKPLDAASYGRWMNLKRPTDVRPADAKASKKGKVGGTIGQHRKGAAKVAPQCPKGFQFENRRGPLGKIKRDRCVSNHLKVAKPICKLRIGDNKKNWGRPYKRKGVDGCSHKKKKSKKPRGVKCKTGFKLEIKAGADRCVAKKPTYKKAVCPEGYRYKHDKDGDYCKRKNNAGKKNNKNK